MAEAIILRDVDVPGITTLPVYRERGGYEAWRKALTAMAAAEVIEQVKRSGLRGRGGAGFPTGQKWSFVPRDSVRPVYLCANADESEPGTFKDRFVMERNPHLFLEGIALAAYAIGAHTAYIYIRGELVQAALLLERCIAEAREAGLLGANIFGTGYSLDVRMHRGAGAYICGEETALLESLEGKRGYPRIKPPYPATHGLWGCPTVVNNVETLAYLPYIVQHGGEAFKRLGIGSGEGLKLYCVSGHVVRPGVYELPTGTSLREILYEHAGGIPGGGRLKAVIPGGSSVPVITEEEIDIPMDWEGPQSVGSMLGSAGIIVMDETTCLVWALLVITRFYAHESCGQCTPCREGCAWMRDILQRIEIGWGRKEDLDLLVDIGGKIEGRTICPLGDAAAWPVQSFLRKFREEFEEHVRLGRCPLPR